MSIRDQLRKVRSTEPEGVGIPYDTTAPPWSTGDDVPLTWGDEEIARLRKRTLRDNWKRGVISKEVYLRYLKMGDVCH